MSTIRYSSITDISKPQRYHNPGAIMKPGTMEMVYYDTDELGIAAMLRLLRSYVVSGHDTIRKIISRWSGLSTGSEALDNYISFVSSNTGIGCDVQITKSDMPDKIVSIAYRMHRYEAGYYWLSYADFYNVGKGIF